MSYLALIPLQRTVLEYWISQMQGTAEDRLQDAACDNSPGQRVVGRKTSV
jgi:hypothetical protein